MSDRDDDAAEGGFAVQHEGLGDGLGEGLAEAQIAAIEGAFMEHDRLIARLRRELEELRTQTAAQPASTADDALEERLAGIEARLDGQDQALRHVLQRLIGFFERERPDVR